jgi:hypothetical protein
MKPEQRPSIRRPVPASLAVFITALVVLIALAGVFTIAPARAAGAEPGESIPGVLVPIVIGPELAAPTLVPRPSAGGGRAATAIFQVTYSGFTAEAQAAFQAAVDIWATQLTSPVPIVVNASFAPLGGSILGQAGAANYLRNFTNAPQGDTFYPVALANTLAGTDLIPGNGDIEAEFSSNFTSWYFGGGTTPVGKINFTSVVLHELGHGLGFAGSATYSGGTGSRGLATPPDPVAYDRFVYNGNGQRLITAFANTSTALGSQYTGGSLYFNGINAAAASGGAPPRLYAPNTWQQGSSYSHLDEATYPAGNANSLMTPAISPGETIYDPGALVRGIFADLGWTVSAPVAPPTPTMTPTATPSPTVTPTPTMVPSPTMMPTATPSPTPTLLPAPSFADVPPGYWAHDQIGRFAQRGITTGCAAGRFCPDRGVTRAEMAVFLDRTLGHGAPPTPAGQTFADVPPGYWAYAHIEQFYRLGVTTGCGTNAQGQLLYCPDRGVTRAEMAAFIDRGLGQARVMPATATFADVPTGHPQYGYIEAFVVRGVTTGCGADARGRRLYCPERGVTRAEMAVFIVRAFP